MLVKKENKKTKEVKEFKMSFYGSVVLLCPLYKDKMSPYHDSWNETWSQSSIASIAMAEVTCDFQGQSRGCYLI